MASHSHAVNTDPMRVKSSQHPYPSSKPKGPSNHRGNTLDALSDTVTVRNHDSPSRTRPHTQGSQHSSDGRPSLQLCAPRRSLYQDDSAVGAPPPTEKLKSNKTSMEKKAPMAARSVVPDGSNTPPVTTAPPRVQVCKTEQPSGQPTQRTTLLPSRPIFVPEPTYATYHTIEEAIALFALTRPKAEQLLAKTEAVVHHGKSKPEGVAEKEDRQLWVEQGYEKLALLDGPIRRMAGSHVVQSEEVAAIRAAVEAMEAGLEKEEEEEERRRVAEAKASEKKRRAAEAEKRAAEEKRRLAEEAKEEERRRIEEEEEEERRSWEDALVKRHRQAAGEEVSDEEDESEVGPTPRKSGTTDKGKGRTREGEDEESDEEVTTRSKNPSGGDPPLIAGREKEVCDRCVWKKSRSQVACGGPRAYSSTKIACARCVKQKQACSFNTRREGKSKRKGKRQVREGDEKGDGGSWSPRTSGTRSESDEDEDRKKRRRVRAGRRGERGENEDSAAWLARAYVELGIAKEQVARAEMAVKRDITRYTQ